MIPLLDAPMVSFGLAGKLSPHRARVVLTTHNRGANLTVSLDAANSNGIEFRGSWGSHRTTTVPPHDFGHGGAGLIADLPAELVDVLLAASCGADWNN